MVHCETESSGLPTHGKAIISEGCSLLVLLVHLVLGIHEILHIVHSLQNREDMFSDRLSSINGRHLL